MSQVTSGLWKVLSIPQVYSAFQNIMGAHKGRRRFVDEYIRPSPGEAVLDIGCGPADILEYLPRVDYWGFDIIQPYIDHATRKYGGKGRFFCKLLTKSELEQMPEFDIVVATGVLHHMDDNMAEDFLALAYQALKPGGRLVTVDPCFSDGQNPIARLLISMDRGRNVRRAEGYFDLASQQFKVQRAETQHKRWIPYTHYYMECVREAT